MKLNIKTIAVFGATLLAGMGLAVAQNTYSGYFIDGYAYRYQMNPALADSTTANFISFPGLGNLNIGLQGNLHLKSVLYNVDGRTALFTNPGVSAAEVMNNIHDRNKIGVESKIGIMSAGFRAWGGYNTISVNACVNANASVPGTLFSLLKEGVSNKTYDIKDLRVSANAYAEIALAHSRDLSKWVPGLRAGIAMKFLIGAGNIDAYLNKANIALGEDQWVGVTNAEIYSSVKGLKYKTDYSNETGRDYVNGADVDGYGLNGFGLGFDLGASYRLNKDWEFSVAVLDLGFISYGDTRLASTNGDRAVNTDKYTFSPDDDATNSFDREWKHMRSDIFELYQLDDMGDVGSRTRALACTLNFGAQYTFPLYRKLAFGLLNTTRINGMFTWTNFRLSANVAPVKCFSAGANVAVGTYGASFGWLINVHPKGFNLFLGMDHTLGKLAKQGVPLSSNAEVNFGINFPF